MRAERRPRFGSMELLVFGLVGFAIAGTWLRAVVANTAALATAATVFCGVFVQALPFLGLGVVVSGLIAVFLPPERLVRWLPRRPAAGGLGAGGAGGGGPGGGAVRRFRGGGGGGSGWRDDCSVREGRRGRQR